MLILKKHCLCLSGLLCLLLLYPAALHAQDAVVSLSGSERTVEDVIRAVEGQSRYGFVFDGKVFDAQRPVEIKAGNMPLEEILGLLFRDGRFQYTIRGRYIVISALQPVLGKPRAPRTDDVYRPGTSQDLERRPVAEVPVRYDTLPAPRKPLPASYSDYRPLGTALPKGNRSPGMALKTNLLYWTTQTPNLGVEIGLGKKSTLEIAGGFNPWKNEATPEKNKKLLHGIIRPEFRYWFCERFEGHFVGLNAFYADYNISNHDVLWLFDKENRYRGTAYGAGIDYGYHWAIGRRWGLEFHIGVGYARLSYDKFSCRWCSTESVPETKNYFGPTRAGISLVFLIR